MKVLEKGNKRGRRWSLMKVLEKGKEMGRR